jgi:translation initiation factor 2B subunit (eIF-2B alpha/beta/delta family)
MFKYKCRNIRNMIKQSNMTSLNSNNSIITHSNNSKVDENLEKEVKRMTLIMIDEFRENIDKYLNELKEDINKLKK